MKQKTIDAQKGICDKNYLVEDKITEQEHMIFKIGKRAIKCNQIWAPPDQKLQILLP